MTIHVSLLENNIFPKISSSIQKRFSKGLMGIKTSMKYQELQDKDYKINEKDRVFLNHRKRGNIYEVFEIHYDTGRNKIINIFWVK